MRHSFEELKKILSSHKEIKVISFDIFDTLLIRPFVKPRDLFFFMEEKYKVKGFAKWRIKKERWARLKLKREITYDEIYANTPRKYEECRTLEKKVEMELLSSNPQIKEIYSYLKNSGYTLIATSDMYFDSAFLSAVLKKNGFDVSNIFVSSEFKCTKRDGKLYDIVIDTLKKDGFINSPSELLHIGDTYKVDIKQASQKGIHTLYLPKFIDTFFENNEWLKKVYNSNKSLASSLIISTIAQKSEYDNEFYKLGYELVGPLSLLYCSFIYKFATQNGIDQLLFVARDGYFLKATMEILFRDNNDIKLSYVYAPRKQYYLTHYDNGVITSWLFEKLFNEKVCKFILDSFNIKSHAPHSYYRFHKQQLLPLLNQTKDKFKYQEYIKRIVTGTNVAIVDNLSSKCTSQKFLQRELNIKLKGLYLGCITKLFMDNKKLNITSFLSPYEYFKLTLPNASTTSLIETIFQSPEENATFVYNTGEVVFSKEKTAFRTKMFGEIKNGVENFLFEFIKTYSEGISLVDPKTFISLCKKFIKFNPSSFKNLKDQILLGKNFNG